MVSMKKFLKKLGKFSVISIAILLIQSCATLVGDNMRTVCIRSNPEGAGVYVDGQRQGTTPATITLPNYIYGGKTVIVKKEGYQEQAMAVNTKFQPCGLLNILFWPGFLIDGATGNTVKIDPAYYNLFAELQAVDSKT